MITLDRLRYFLVAAKLEHVGLAAKELHTSPSVISSAIKELEISIGSELFIREKNKIRLSLSGRILIERAKKILDDVSYLEGGLGESESPIRGHFRLGASHFLMNEVLVPAVLKLKEISPDFTAEFVSLDSGMAVSQVVSGVLDAAFIFRSSYFEKLEEIVVHEDAFHVFVRENHPVLRMPTKKRVNALNAMSAISFRTNTGANFWEKHPALIKLGLFPKHSFFYNDTKTAIQLLKKSNGWAFLPGILGKRSKEIAKVGFLEEIKAPVNISIIYNSNQRLLPFIQRMNDCIRAVI